MIWSLLFSAAILFQLWRERKRPPFPPCPYQVYKNKRKAKVAETINKPASENQYIVNGERAPLITSSWQPEGYAAGSGPTAAGGGYGTSPGYNRVQSQKPEIIDPL